MEISVDALMFAALGSPERKLSDLTMLPLLSMSLSELCMARRDQFVSMNLTRRINCRLWPQPALVLIPCGLAIGERDTHTHNIPFPNTYG